MYYCVHFLWFFSLQEGVKEKLAADSKKEEQEQQEQKEKGKEKAAKDESGRSSVSLPRKVCKQQSVDSGNEASSEDSNDSNKYNKGMMIHNTHLNTLLFDSL